MSNANTEYEFLFNTPFEMLATIFDHNDDGSISINSESADNFYSCVFVKEDNTLAEIRQTMIKKPKNGGYGMIFNSNSSKFLTRWSFKDDDHPTDSTDSEDEYDRTAWCKFELSSYTYEESTTIKDDETITVAKTSDEIYTITTNISLKLSLKDKTAEISTVTLKLKQMGETSQKFVDETTFPVIIEKSLVDNSINIGIEKKDDNVGDFMLLIIATDTNEQKHYKTISFKVV